MVAWNNNRNSYPRRTRENKFQSSEKLKHRSFHHQSRFTIIFECKLCFRYLVFLEIISFKTILKTVVQMCGM